MILAVIPARYASSRFPGKPLVKIGNKTMVQRVCEQVSGSKSIHQLVVATDDTRIFEHVREAGFSAMMTSPDCQSGTDRCAEVAQHFPQARAVLNVQGDEPFIQPQQIDLLVDTFLQDESVGIATLAKKVTDTQQIFNPNVVKVVCTAAGKAMYFSRHPIPFLRHEAKHDQWGAAGIFLKHIGLYIFNRKILLELAALPPSPLEKSESLEQLRWLENGYSIRVGYTEMETIGIDVPEDLERIKHMIY